MGGAVFSPFHLLPVFLVLEIYTFLKKASVFCDDIRNKLIRQATLLVPKKQKKKNYIFCFINIHRYVSYSLNFLKLYFFFYKLCVYACVWVYGHECRYLQRSEALKTWSGRLGDSVSLLWMLAILWRSN